MKFFKKKTEIEKHEKEIDKVVGIINVKCAYGAKLSILNEVEKTLYFNDIFHKEIENGGFSMLFFHPAGAYALDMVESLHAIGAMKCSQLLKEAIAMFPEDLSKLTNEQRQDALERIDPEETAFFELNEAMQSMGEDITVYQTAYMLKHKEELR